MDKWQKISGILFLVLVAISLASIFEINRARDEAARWKDKTEILLKICKSALQ